MNLKLGVFLTASVYNADANIQSSLPPTSLHGRVAPINQHSTRNNLGQSRECSSLNQVCIQDKATPNWYTEVPPYHLPNDTPVPVCSKPSNADLLETFVMLEDETWL